MLTLCLSLSAAIYGYLQRYMPTNRAIAWLRTARGLKWAIPVALTATPAYLFTAVICAGIIENGGPGWLNLLVLWTIWNSMKFAWMAVLSLPLMAGRALRRAGRSAR